MIENKALVWLLVILSAAFALILWPYAGAVLWAVFIALVFEPLHRRIERKLGSKRPSVPALLTLAIVVVIVIIPLVLLGTSVVQEAAVLYQKMKSGEIEVGQYFQKAVAALPTWARSILERFGLADLGALQTSIAGALTRSGQQITSGILGLSSDALDFLVAFFVMLYVLFFLIRDGRSLVQLIAHHVPLQTLQTSRLFDQFTVVVRATVKGNILVALIQGTLGGLAFWVLGVQGPLLWGALMAILSLLPAVGAALVWGPVALYYLLTGEIASAAGLAAWGVIVIGLVDNLLRPLLVGKETRMPDYLVLISTLGGLAVFGLNGFVIGPVIAAMFLVCWDMFTASRKRPDLA
jgi:predicted PurR-regulated permease PerM